MEWTSKFESALAATARIATLLLLLVIFPSTARAQLTNIQYTTTSDGNGGLIITGFSASGSGPLSIPGTITVNSVARAVTGIGAESFYRNTTLTSVTIPNSVTSIGVEAFFNCYNLTSVTIPASVTSIGTEAFSGSGLTSAVFQGNAPTMGFNVFLVDAAPFDVDYYLGSTGFTSPTWIDSSYDYWPAVDLGTNPAQFITTTANNQVTITGYTGSSGAVIIPGIINGLPVVSIGSGAFQNNSSLASVTIPASVTSIGAGAFANCTSLTSAAFLGNAPTMGSGVFSGAAGGFAVDFNYGATGFSSPTWTDSSGDPWPTVESTNPALFTTTTATNPAQNQITITGYTGSSGPVVIPTVINNLPVVSIGQNAFMFSPITSITIPNGVGSIGENALSDCNSLTSVTIPASVTAIGQNPDTADTGVGQNNPFANCPSLISITVSAQNSTYSSVGGVLFNNNQTMLVAYPGGLPGSYTIPASVTSIGTNAFENDTSLSSVTIPNSVTSIGSGSFDGCTSLTSVTIPASVTSIGVGAFTGCTSLTAITVSAQNTAYSSVGGVLFNNNQTTLDEYPGGIAGSYTIPNSVTSIGYAAFEGCTNLTSVAIPASVTSIGYNAFEGCTSLTSVTIPAGVTSIGYYAFYRCTSLTSITVSAQNTAYSSVGGVLFNNNQTMLVAYPGGIAGGYTIPNTVTSIEYEAFYGCASLTSVTIPSSVTSIGGYAFYGCPNLTSAIFLGNAPTMGQYVFYDAAGGFTVDYYNGATGFTSPTWSPDFPDSYTAVNLGTLPGTSNPTDTPTMPPWALALLALLLFIASIRLIREKSTRAAS